MKIVQTPLHIKTTFAEFSFLHDFTKYEIKITTVSISKLQIIIMTLKNTISKKILRITRV